jgi:hypothetical protein
MRWIHAGLLAMTLVACAGPAPEPIPTRDTSATGQAQVDHAAAHTTTPATSTPLPASSASPAPSPTAIPTAQAGQPCPVALHDPTGYHGPLGPNDCLWLHEHGEAPPEWVDAWLSAQERSLFGHYGQAGAAHHTSERENTAKHVAMRGYQLDDGDWRVYAAIHGGAYPFERTATHHSYQLWIRGPLGSISYLQGWYDMGDVTRPVDQGGSLLVLTAGQAAPAEPRPIVITLDRDSQGVCETWYSRSGGFYGAGGLPMPAGRSAVTPDIGLTWCGMPAFHTDDELDTAYDIDSWDWHGNGGSQRLELALYNGFGGRDLPGPGAVWVNQLGLLAEGPDDPLACRGEVQMYSQTIALTCLPWMITPELAASDGIMYPGNAHEATPDLSGVDLQRYFELYLP